MLLPKMKLETVSEDVTVKMVMPPRMPIVLEGVVMLIGAALLILPPTRRNTPFVALIASSPFLVSGSKTNLSTVSWALGPTVSEVPSRKTRCARSLALVVMISLAWTSMPTRNMRSASEGGLPRGSPSVAEVTPTGAAAVGKAAAPANAVARNSARYHAVVKKRFRIITAPREFEEMCAYAIYSNKHILPAVY